jgi:hypothetical protein
VSPTSGRAMQTLFTLALVNWVDDPDVRIHKVVV